MVDGATRESTARDSRQPDDGVALHCTALLPKLPSDCGGAMASAASHCVAMASAASHCVAMASAASHCVAMASAASHCVAMASAASHCVAMTSAASHCVAMASAASSTRRGTRCGSEEIRSCRRGTSRYILARPTCEWQQQQQAQVAQAPLRDAGSLRSRRCSHALSRVRYSAYRRARPALSSLHVHELVPACPASVRARGAVVLARPNRFCNDQLRDVCCRDTRR
ncbi:unnamed protein product [Closterium sp. NIES-54]